MAKIVSFDSEARTKLKSGIDQLANAVKVTLGPKGRNVVIQKSFGAPVITKDGVTVAKEIELEDAIENMGAQMVKEVASKTADAAGDGTTTATVLAQAMVNRLYRQQLEDKLLDYSTDGLEIKGKIENAQLSRLRTLVRQAWQEQQPQLVHDFLQALRDTAKNQFRRARLDGKTFLRWLEDGWKEEGLWKSYFYIAPGNLPVLANVTAQDKPALRLEYMARLVDVICKRAIQQEQQAEQKENAA